MLQKDSDPSCLRLAETCSGQCSQHERSSARGTPYLRLPTEVRPHETSASGPRERWTLRPLCQNQCPGRPDTPTPFRFEAHHNGMSKGKPCVTVFKGCARGDCQVLLEAVFVRASSALLKPSFLVAGRLVISFRRLPWPVLWPLPLPELNPCSMETPDCMLWLVSAFNILERPCAWGQA